MLIHITTTFRAGFEGFPLAPYGYGLKVKELAVCPASAFQTFDHCQNGDSDHAWHRTQMMVAS
jgi:hypothetical protein